MLESRGLDCWDAIQVLVELGLGAPRGRVPGAASLLALAAPAALGPAALLVMLLGLGWVSRLCGPDR